MFKNPIWGIQKSLSFVFDLSLRIGSSQLQLPKFQQKWDSESDFTIFTLSARRNRISVKHRLFLLRQSLFIWFTKHWTSKGKKLTFPTFPTFRLEPIVTSQCFIITTESQKLNLIIFLVFRTQNNIFTAQNLTANEIENRLRQKRVSRHCKSVFKSFFGRLLLILVLQVQ